MAYKSLFVDSDIFLDQLLERDIFYEFAEVLLVECAKRQIGLNTSALIIANVYYLLSQKYGKVKAKERLSLLLNRVNVFAFDKQAIDFAISSQFTDFEDAIQHHIATVNNCDVIITRNIKDYKHSTIPVLTAEQFLREII